MPRSRRRILRLVGLGLSAVLVLGAAVTGVVLAKMFPSSDSLPWRPPPPADARFAQKSTRPVFRFVERAPELRFEGDVGSALAQVSRYRYLRDSPYLPADRVSARRVFSVAAGDVLVDEDLAQVKHAGAVYEGRYALYLPTGTTVSADLDLPPGATLSLATTVLPDFEGVKTCEAQLTVSVVRGGVEQTLFERRLTRRADGADFAWTPVNLPLGAGGPARVVLRARSVDGCAGFGHVFLADPTVHAPAAEPPPVNVLYINICTLRADDLGVLGQPRPVSPHLDALAASGAVFTQARANGNWSKSSQMSALTGRYPSNIGNKYYRSMVEPYERDNYTHLAWPTLPSLLRARGYETLALVDNVFLHDFLRLGVDLGFARVRDDARHITNGVALMSDAVEWLEGQGERPFFMYINVANPHSKYRPPREDLFRSGFGWRDLTGDLQRALHLGEVAFTDRAVGQLLEALDRLGLRERTLVVVHSDHGELLDAEHDLEVTVRSTTQPRTLYKYPNTIYKHGWTWFDAEMRVPLLLALPGRVEANQRVDRPVTLVDVAPTILGLLGIEPPPTFQGRSLFARTRHPVVVEGKQFKSIVEGNWKLVRFHEGMTTWRRHATGETVDRPALLYDLEQDPEERVDRAAERPEIVERLGRVLDAEIPVPSPLHLLAFQGPPGTRYEGRVEASRPLWTATLRHQAPGDRVRPDGRGLRFSVEVGPTGSTPPILAFSADGPLDTVDLQVSADGRPLPRAALRLGPHALPLLPEGDAGRFRVEGHAARWLGIGAGQRPTWADEGPSSVAAQGPVVRWWTQRIAEGGPEGFSEAQLDGNVMDAMRDWGYAH